MSFANSDGVRLYFEEAGAGDAVVFVHELHSDYRGWEAQMRWFSRNYRSIAYNARGYPPSDVPDDPGAYGMPFVVHDLAAVLRGRASNGHTWWGAAWARMPRCTSA